MNTVTKFGIDPSSPRGYAALPEIKDYTNLKLEALGLRESRAEDTGFTRMTRPLLQSFREHKHLLSNHLNPVDQRIQTFIDGYFADVGEGLDLNLPHQTVILDQHGVARVLSLPEDGDLFESPIISSYRIHQGVLHNPVNDRRTTKGVFHVSEGGLPIPDDKLAVPKNAAAHILARALKPPREIATLPYQSGKEDAPPVWVSLLLRPIVCPEVPGFCSQKRMEVRFFAPGNLVSNLDFVESIFGNGGDPNNAINDSGLDPETWTGTTGCVILAPHLVGMKKKEIGLPHIDNATDLQKKHGMCWESEDELYNNGGAFKMTFRTAEGVVVTVIADNYFGYCKKEVKTQISFSANLTGLAEEEHAGGALIYSAYDLGESFEFGDYFDAATHSFEEVAAQYTDFIDLKPEGYGVDRRYSDILYVPEDVQISLIEQSVTWQKDGISQALRLVPNTTYVLPSGYKVEMIKPAEGRRWRLRGTVSEGLFCHKPCTVSGGGKSEISKSISDAILSGPVYVKDYHADFAMLAEIFGRDYSDHCRDSALNHKGKRPFLGNARSLGSVIKLLTPSPEFTDNYNTWIESIPQHIKDLAFVIKRIYREDWGENWAERFSVDAIDGRMGNELRYKGNKMLTQYLRVGYRADGTWRTFSLRKDFLPATKISQEDDISASIVVPSRYIPGYSHPENHPSVKVITNCEHRFFQRPDEAIHRGYDKQTEADMAADGNFLSNYQPLIKEDAIKQIEDPIRFEQYTPAMQDSIRAFADNPDSPDYFCSPANPRIVDGVPTKNPRYLQVRPDILDDRTHYLSTQSTRLYRKLKSTDPVINPVSAVLTGRRNNPPEPEAGIRSLAVYNPIHYMELPELFMEFIASITGKSPSTTGAGSEGALTKAPFNAMWPIHDLNYSLLSFVTTRYDGFLSSAGYVGPKYRVDHDVSLLVPELWSRMRAHERNAKYLKQNGFLEKLNDFEHNGKTVLASRLGYRITPKFVRMFFGRIFNNPAAVFPVDVLRPEQQDIEVFVDGVDNIAEAHKWVAQRYLDDGSVKAACTPLKALLNIMATGSYEGKTLTDPEIRDLFKPENILSSAEYKQVLENQQNRDRKATAQRRAYLEAYLDANEVSPNIQRTDIEARLVRLKEHQSYVESADFLSDIHGTIGCDFQG